MGEWMPVTEKLPEELPEYTNRKAISVLVCTKRGTVHSCNRESYTSYYDGKVSWNWGRIKDVIAWMTLPKPYKEVK